MINRVILNLFLVLLISCSKKENVGEYASGPSQDGIIGKWRLVETISGDGTAQSNKVDVSSRNYTVTFNANGEIQSGDFACSGKYTYTSNKRGEIGDENLKVGFDKCEASEMLWYSIAGNADARIVDHNTLILNSATCDEPCTRVYRRLK